MKFVKIFGLFAAFNAEEESNFFPARETRGWTLNSIGNNRGLNGVLRRMVDYKMMHKRSPRLDFGIPEFDY
ncbi:Oidioi.mRNA.OKI2018_I69.chr1.g898.t1.cds [Oikopleura dioica]|uniref:Oidioi.mRNA.OKI2018_I69.chr1.g898.t1.cds n=1 Tax=Oikopleura dioica TaxID=34765 RepID=A0ABN7SLC4_OIKDI|nr:Oidioi.mRNA.OKI2018_I69.chr1.g898.t1.cds [Oikopleura dioica]